MGEGRCVVFDGGVETTSEVEGGDCVEKEEREEMTEVHGGRFVCGVAGPIVRGGNVVGSYQIWGSLAGSLASFLIVGACCRRSKHYLSIRYIIRSKQYYLILF